MKLNSFTFLLLTLCFLNCAPPKPDERVTLSKVKPIILEENGNELFQYWQIENQNYLYEYETGDVNALDAYKDSISQAIGNAVLQNMIREDRTQSEAGGKRKDSLNNHELIHEGYLGKIRNVNYLEAELLNYQISRFPMFSHPTEFHGFITENDSLGLIRIYFGASDQKWPPKPKPIISHLEKSLQGGWKLISHLHNHYEPASDNFVGVMAPSLADAHYFKALRGRFNLPEALITNGFSTLVLKEENFDKLNSH